MRRFSKILLLAGAGVFVLTVFRGVQASGVRGALAQQDGDGGAYRQIDVYSEVLRHIQSDYVTQPNIPAVTNGALRGLLESLDADSSYLSAKDYEAYKAQEQTDKGTRAQVGMVVSKRYGYATVVSVVPGSPAEKANFQDGDILEAIGGVDTRDMSLALIKVLLEGKAGTEVNVSVVRPGKPDPDKVTMTRAITAEPPVSETMYEDSSIVYLKPEILDKEHVSALEAKLKASEKGGPKKVLLDLRDVSRGEFPEAVRLANFFLKSGTIGSLQGQKVQTVTFTADAAKAIDPTAPMVVLVNQGTAGPAELVAAALQGNKRAELVGEKTFGEGSEQKTFDLPDGAAVILTVAKYEGPEGKKLQDDAVTPGVLVAGNEADSDGADESDGGAASAPAAKPAVTVDEQLTKGLDLLKAKTA